MDGQEIAASHADRCDNGKKRIVVAKGIIRVAKQFGSYLAEAIDHADDKTAADLQSEP
jgi:hypothetical protein